MPNTLAIKEIVYLDGGIQGDTGVEAAAQTFKRGNFLVGGALDAKGRVPWSESGVGAAAGTKLVLSQRDSGNLAANMDVQKIKDETILEITAGGLASTAALLTPGLAYGILKDATTGFHYLNLADTTNTVLSVDGFYPTDANGYVGDTNVRVRVKVLPTRRL